MDESREIIWHVSIVPDYPHYPAQPPFNAEAASLALTKIQTREHAEWITRIAPEEIRFFVTRIRERLTEIGISEPGISADLSSLELFAQDLEIKIATLDALREQAARGYP